MNTEKIEHLLSKFEEGKTTLQEEATLRDYFRSDDIPKHLKSYEALFLYHKETQNAKTSGQIDPFGKITFEDSEDEPQMASGMIPMSNNVMPWTLRMAAGFILLLVGFSAGLLVGQSDTGSNDDVTALRQEVEKVKKALVYGSYGQASASDRISAINISARMPAVETDLKQDIAEILIHTMNNDDNVNVRQAAAEALFRFREEPAIRRALIHSLARQTNPLMQITLIDMLVKLREKGALSEMQRLLMNTNTPSIVKARLEAGIAELEA